jgi:hypothetical protein
LKNNKKEAHVPEVGLARTLRVPADPAAQALGELLSAIAGQEGPWRGFALHVSLGDLRLPDVGYVAVPIDLTVEKEAADAHVFDISFVSTSLPAAFPGFKGRMGVEAGALGECSLFLRGTYDPPMQLFGRLLDAALTPGVAERSLENFIEEIGAACEARVNQREAEFVRYRFYSRSLR